MPFRIHKIIGYGAILPPATREKLFDYLDDHGTDGEVATVMEAARDSKQYTDGVTWLIECPGPLHKTYPRRFTDLIHYAESVDANVNGYTVIMPPAVANKWYRFGDDIDHYEWFAADLCRDRMSEKGFIPIPGLYYRFMDVKTGMVVDEHVHSSSVIFPPDMSLAPWAFTEDGRGLVPHVPPPVQVLINLFALGDWKTWRPIAATWWA